MRSKLALLLAISVLAPAWARAGIELQAISWQTARWEKGKPGKPADIAALPARPIKGRLLAKLKLLNRGPKEVDGILLRYSVTPKIAPKDKKDLGTWVVPIVVEERRVPKVGANQIVDVPIDVTSAIDLNLKRVASEGYEASELKIDVMLVPRPGDDEKIQLVTSTLPVGQ